MAPRLALVCGALAVLVLSLAAVWLIREFAPTRGQRACTIATAIAQDRFRVDETHAETMVRFLHAYRCGLVERLLLGEDACPTDVNGDANRFRNDASRWCPSLQSVLNSHD